ncbi:hypothetical protein [Streptomyces sp. NPDC000878]
MMINRSGRRGAQGVGDVEAVHVGQAPYGACAASLRAPAPVRLHAGVQPLLRRPVSVWRPMVSPSSTTRT